MYSRGEARYNAKVTHADDAAIRDSHHIGSAHVQRLSRQSKRPWRTIRSKFRAGIDCTGRTGPAHIKLVGERKTLVRSANLRGTNQNPNHVKHSAVVEKLRRVKIGFLELGKLNPQSFGISTTEKFDGFESC